MKLSRLPTIGKLLGPGNFSPSTNIRRNDEFRYIHSIDKQAIAMHTIAVMFSLTLKNYVNLLFIIFLTTVTIKLIQYSLFISSKTSNEKINSLL